MSGWKGESLDEVNTMHVTVDLSNSMLLFWEKLSIAQAQNNIYRMAALAGDSTKHTTLAFHSKSTNKLFNEALTAA
jgi:hypothetical protein